MIGFGLRLLHLLFGEFNELLKNELKICERASETRKGSTYLDGANIAVLSDVFVLVETIFRGFSFSQVDGQLNEKEHHRLQGSDGAVSGPLGGNMFVEDIQRRLRLVNSDEFLRSLLDFSQLGAF